MGDLAAAALSPELQGKLLEQTLAATSQPSSILLKEAQARQLDKTPTFAERFEGEAALKVLDSILKQERPNDPVKGNFRALAVGPNGNPSNQPHEWLVDPTSGRRIAYIGPLVERQGADAVGAAQSRAMQQQRLWLAFDNRAYYAAGKIMESRGLGKIVVDGQGNPQVQLNNPTRDGATLEALYQREVALAKQQGYLPTQWISDKPSITEGFTPQQLQSYAAEGLDPLDVPQRGGRMQNTGATGTDGNPIYIYIDPRGFKFQTFRQGDKVYIIDRKGGAIEFTP